MKKDILNNAILFSMERGPYPYKYRLYFAVWSEEEETYAIHRFFVRRKKQFAQFILGGVYDLVYAEIRILDFRMTNHHQLKEQAYLAFTQMRDSLFMDEREAAHIGLYEEDYDPADVYYTFDLYKSLVEYQPPFWKKFAINLMRTTAYFLGLFIPIALYILFIYVLSVTISGNNTLASTAVTIPIAAAGTFPFILWMMYAINLATESLMLNMEYTRAYVLRNYALRWGGIRKSCVPNPNEGKKLKKYGIITGGIMLFCILFALIIL